MEVGWALLFGSSLATATLYPAATGDTALLQELYTLSMQGLVGVSPGLCVTSRKIFWSRPCPMTSAPSQHLPYRCTRAALASCTSLCPAVCNPCRTWRSLNNLSRVQGLMLVSSWPLLSLTWCRAESWEEALHPSG